MLRRSETILRTRLASFDRPAVVRAAFVLGLTAWIPHLTSLTRREVSPPRFLAAENATRLAVGSGDPAGVDRVPAWTSARFSANGRSELVPTAGERGRHIEGLDAIVINPSGRLAVIAGQTVRVGDPVAWNGQPWTVTSIDPRCVVIGQGDGVRLVGLILPQDALPDSESDVSTHNGADASTGDRSSSVGDASLGTAADVATGRPVDPRGLAPRRLATPSETRTMPNGRTLR